MTFPERGVELKVPSDIAAGIVSGSNVARADRRASVSIDEFPGGTSIDNAYAADLSRYSSPVFKKKAEGWYALSGFDGDSIYYRKCEAFGGKLVAFTLRFPTSEKPRYDPLIKGMETSLRPVGGVVTARPTPKKSIACQGQTCDTICCTEGTPVCVSDANDCTRATNGEGRFLECDGPEDCASGEACCYITLGRTYLATCTPASGCKTPQEVLCHKDADCSPGKCLNPADNGAWHTCG